MRVGIIALQHESNTFVRRLTTIADFKGELLAVGEAVRTHYGGGTHEIGGFFDGLDEARLDPIPVFAAAATPGGTIEGGVFDTLLARLVEALDAAGHLDALLVAPHGAAVSEDELDVDGRWLDEVRQRIGSGIPMVCTIDPHANLSRRMVNACDAILPYRTNPHVDQYARGIEAARLIARTLRGDIRPTLAVASPRVAINIAAQHTSVAPAADLIALADRQLDRDGVLANGVVLGFPYADVPEMGSSFVAVTDDDPRLAQRLADELATYLLAHRRQFQPQLADVSQAVDAALSAEPPVCLLDMGDNVGGGSPGDGTLIAGELWRRGMGPTLVCLCDPISAGAAEAAGIGAAIDLQIGGKTDTLHGPPLDIRGARVLSTHAGIFTETDVRHGGKAHYDMGLTAVVECGGVGGKAALTALLHSLRTPPFSLGQVTSCGLDVADFRFVIAKGVNAPKAAYGPVCRTFIAVDTPGVTTADMTRLYYKQRRRPMFPFEEPGVVPGKTT